MALLYWTGGVRVIAGTLTIGVLISFIQYAQRFFRPIQDLSEKFNILQAAMAASERIFGLLDEPVTIVSRRENTFAARSARRNRVPQRVVRLHRRRRRRKKRTGCCATFRSAWSPGRHWPSWATPARARPRLFSFCCVSTTSSAAKSCSTAWIFAKWICRICGGMFGIVLQDPFLFTGTLESNVKLGSENIDRAGAESALREVGLGPFLDSQPQGVETPVTERGATLSVGQRQLVSFARALAHNPKFLILDEATSSVDTKTELLIREALEPAAAGTHGHGDRAPPKHDSARASHSRVPQGAAARTGLAPGIACAARNILPPVPTSIQRAGT